MRAALVCTVLGACGPVVNACDTAPVPAPPARCVVFADADAYNDGAHTLHIEREDPTYLTWYVGSNVVAYSIAEDMTGWTTVPCALSQGQSTTIEGEE